MENSFSVHLLVTTGPHCLELRHLVATISQSLPCPLAITGNPQQHGLMAVLTNEGDLIECLMPVGGHVSRWLHAVTLNLLNCHLILLILPL